MSWDDNPDDEDARKALRKWLGDFLPEDVLRNIEDMMQKMLGQMGNGSMFDQRFIDELMKNPHDLNPLIFGFSMTIGPDGKPVIQRFGHRIPENPGEPVAPQLEPIVDVIEETDEIVVVAELPGVEKDEIKVNVKGKILTIDVSNQERPYHRELELPAKVKKEEAKSSLRNGVLEVRLKKA
ncbi:MAG: heat-shock protein Hsp20 [Candidatus Thorarchaeota archaeon]|nr:MAG: heat-shock protein Hsp20 [Candidatus Thorarchaeota archaeon]